MKYNILDECVAEYFTKRRKQFDYSLKDIADKLGIPKTSYYYYETGKMSIPKEHVKQLLMIYNEDGDELLEELQKACSRYLIDLYAYLHGYEVSMTFTKGEEDAGL